jgi:hypothetical protein
LHFHQVSAQPGRGDEHENHSRQDKQQLEPHGKTVAYRQTLRKLSRARSAGKMGKFGKVERTCERSATR